MTGSGSRPKPPTTGSARAPAGASNRPKGDKGGPVSVTELSYTEASRELDAIVEYFEQREVDVDQLVARLERATAIVDELDRRLRQTRMQVEELVPRLEAAAREVAMPAVTERDEDGNEDEDEDQDDAEDDFDEDLDAWAEGEAEEVDSDRPLF